MRRRRGRAGRYVVRTGVVGGKAGIFVFVVGWLESGGDGRRDEMRVRNVEEIVVVEILS